MPTVTITEQLYDAAGQPDNAPWSFYSALRESSPTGSVITERPIIATPVNGVLTVALEPGPMTAQHRNTEYNFTVPATDSELWPLISAAVSLPPSTPQDMIDAAVANYLTANPVTKGDPGAPVDDVQQDANGNLVFYVQGAPIGNPIPMPSGGGATISYNFDNGTVAPPSSKAFRLNNTNPTLATAAYCSTTATNGADMRNVLPEISTGGRIGFQDENDATKYHEYNVVAPSVNNTTYFTLSLAWIKGTGTFNNNQTTPMLIWKFAT
jgi:hypothetical protein